MSEPQIASGEIAGTSYNIIWVSGVMFSLNMSIRVMPYVRMTQRSKHANPRAKEYLDNQAAIRDRVVLIMSRHEIEPFDRKDKLRVHFKVVRTAERGDFDNFIKAVADGLQHALYPNDSQIRSVVFDMEKGKEPHLFARVERIEPLST